MNKAESGSGENQSHAVLDCESQESTVNSISAIYSLPQKDIIEFLNRFDIEEYFEKYDPNEEADQVLLKLFKNEFRVQPKRLDYIYWFHLTRTEKNNKFKDGILPLNEAIEIIWEKLFGIFNGTKHLSRLRHMHSHGVEDRLYLLKTSKKYLGGPYGLLIWDERFRGTEVGTHFLDLPEIIEDICNGYEKTYEESIHEEVKKSLVPCVVKFKSNAEIHKRCISVALYYLYKSCHNKELTIYCNTCFDGESVPISASDIIKIEYL